MTNISNHAQIGSYESNFRYFDLGRHWNSRLRNIFESDVVQAQLFKDFSKYVEIRESRFKNIVSDTESPHHISWSYKQTDKPRRWDPSDWRCGRLGRPYSFNDYFCYGACLFIVNSLLITARIAIPDKPWIIVRGMNHATVWDQRFTFFDMNYYALKVSPEDCARNTVLSSGRKCLAEGELLVLGEG